MNGRLISPVYGFGSSGRERRMGERPARPIRIAVDVLERLQPAARERGISVSELAQKLLDTISAENMTAAVLDDEKEVAARKRER